MERLSPLDLSNLRVEDRGMPMHVAALAFLEAAPLLDPGGELSLGRIREHLERRLDLAPRLRQVVMRPRAGLGPPVWVDHAGFDIREHVRTRTVPVPGDEAAVLEVCATLNEPPLDRSRPLWELWVLTGLADGTVGLLIRLHHVVADGIAAVTLIGALFDDSADAVTQAAQPWTPRPPLGSRELLVENLRQRARAIARAPSRLRPTVVVGHAAAFVLQLQQLVRDGFAPRVSFNRPVGRHRRLYLVRTDLDGVKAVAHAHGAKVNDVLLAVVAGGARRMLEHRGELRPGLALKASVPISMRGPADDRGSGNRVGIMVVPLPVGEPDPVLRIEEIARATVERKRRPPLQPAARLLQRWMVQAMFLQRLVNVFTSNVPGPPKPMYFAGARILEVFQVGVVQGNVPISVGALSYAGRLNLDIVGDADATPDLHLFATGVCEALERFGVRRRKACSQSTDAALASDVTAENGSR